MYGVNQIAKGSVAWFTVVVFSIIVVSVYPLRASASSYSNWDKDGDKGGVKVSAKFNTSGTVSATSSDALKALVLSKPGPGVNRLLARRGPGGLNPIIPNPAGDQTRSCQY